MDELDIKPRRKRKQAEPTLVVVEEKTKRRKVQKSDENPIVAQSMLALNRFCRKSKHHKTLRKVVKNAHSKHASNLPLLMAFVRDLALWLEQGNNISIFEKSQAFDKVYDTIRQQVGMDLFRSMPANLKQIELSKDIKALRDESICVFNAFTKEKTQQSLPGMHTKNIRCKECGENNVYYVQLQTRSMDEGATTFYTCAECGKCWVRGFSLLYSLCQKERA